MKRALLYCAGGGIGDSLIATVVAQALHQRFDIVDALTLPEHRSTLERTRGIDGVWVDAKQNREELAAAVRERNYDACVVTWATARSAQVAHDAAIPIRVGQSRRLYSRQFTHRVPVRSERGDVTSHWSDILLDYARAIDCDLKNARPIFVPTVDDERQALQLRSELNLEPGAYLVLHPNNAVASARGNWPTRGWARLARALFERTSLPVLVTGSAADEPIVRAIVAQAQCAATQSIAGRTGIGALGALSRDAHAFVGISTGSMHVAAAAGARTVGIFPFQSDFPERWAPLCERRAIVRASFACHRGDRKESCSDYACIEALDWQRIVAAVEGLLCVP